MFKKIQLAPDETSLRRNKTKLISSVLHVSAAPTFRDNEIRAAMITIPPDSCWLSSPDRLIRSHFVIQEKLLSQLQDTFKLRQRVKCDYIDKEQTVYHLNSSGHVWGFPFKVLYFWLHHFYQRTKDLCRRKFKL